MREGDNEDKRDLSYIKIKTGYSDCLDGRNGKERSLRWRQGLWLGRGHGTRWGTLVLSEASGQLDRSGTCVLST